MEISKLVESPDNIRQDMGDALELAREHFKTKYLRRIQKAVEAERMRAMANPPREVALITALKEFAPPQSHENFDRMADMFITLSSWQEIRANLEHSGGQGAGASPAGRVYARSLSEDGGTVSHDESVHHDGVYDIDHECSAGRRFDGGRLAEMMFMLSLLGK